MTLALVVAILVMETIKEILELFLVSLLVWENDNWKKEKEKVSIVVMLLFFL